MAQEYYTILTNAGLAYEAQSKANQTPIRLTHMAVGDGNGAAYNPGQEATALRRETHRQEINALLQDEDNPSWLLAEALLPDDVGGFTIREVGIYTDTGILYAIGKYPDSVKPILAQGSTKQFYVRAIFQTSNASIVTLVVDNNVVQATRAFVLDHVKSELEKLDHKNSVRVATTAAIVLSGTQTIDGIALAVGDRVLVKNQASAAANGIYVVSGGAWTRAVDADASLEVTPGMLVPVEQGTANADSVWQLVTDAPITLGTTALVFEVAAGPTGITAGTFHSVTVDKRGRVTGGQPLAANLSALAGLAGAADKLPYFTGLGALNLASITAKARSLLASIDESEMRTFLQLVKQATDIDSTAGSVLLVGAGGWLGTSLPAFPGFETARVGLYIITDITAVAGAPAGTSGAYVIFVRRNNHYTLYQNATGAAARTFEGVSTDGGAAPPVWRELWHSGNLIKQTSETDTTLGRMMAVGAFGLGATTSLGTPDLNNVTATGFYQLSGPGGNAPGTGTWFVFHQQGNNSTRAVQYAASAGSLGYWVRRNLDGTWGAWVELWHSGNLVKQASAFDATAGSALLVGAGGVLGSPEVLSGSWNDLGGRTRAVRGALNSMTDGPFVGALWLTGWYLDLDGTGNNAVFQGSIVTNGPPRYFSRSKAAGVWGAWVEGWHSGNFTPSESAPPGKLGYFARNTAPPGWLKSNGAAVSRTTFAALFAAIGTTYGAGDGSTTFNLPDERGEFRRAWDDGRGVDSGRAFGSWQSDELRSHTHTVGGSVDGGGGSASFDGNPTGASFNKTTSATGGGETHPRNLAFLACIKY